jgi:biotin carboxyl carrier protein
MTDRDGDLAGVRRAADELIPRLAERLARSGLGELEVREGSLRVRVAAASAPAAPTMVGPTVHLAAHPTAATATHGDRDAGAAHHGVTSPAVGFFVFADGLGPGLKVEKGDALGHVEMLGVRHDVRSPRRGMVRNLVTEAGEPVDYGQLLIELEGAE